MISLLLNQLRSVKGSKILNKTMNSDGNESVMTKVVMKL